MVEFKILKTDILTEMLNSDLTWYVSENGFGMIISDGQLLDY